MSFGWMGNYDERPKSRFVAASGSEPEVVWPSRGFHADAYGGHGEDCVTSSRYDVLARDNPAWAKAVLAAAVAAGMPVLARRIGSAGTYRFWLLCAASPAEAEAQSRRLKAEAEARNNAREIARLTEHHRIPAGHRMVSADGAVIPATAASLQWRGWSGRQEMLVGDAVLPIPAGASLHDEGGIEVAPYRSARSAQWLPRAQRLNTDPASAWEWESMLAAREQAIIIAGRAAKAARRASKTVAAPVESQSPFAVLAALKG